MAAQLSFVVAVIVIVCCNAGHLEEVVLHHRSDYASSTSLQFKSFHTSPRDPVPPPYQNYVTKTSSASSSNDVNKSRSRSLNTPLIRSAVGTKSILVLCAKTADSVEAYARCFSSPDHLTDVVDKATSLISSISYGRLNLSPTVITACVMPLTLTHNQIQSASFGDVFSAVQSAGLTHATPACQYNTDDFDHVFVFARGQMHEHVLQPYAIDNAYAWLREPGASMERKFGGYVIPGNVSDAANQIDELRSFSDGKFVNLAAALVKTVLYQNGAPISSMHRGLWNDKVQGGDITDVTGSAHTILPHNSADKLYDTSIGVKHGIGWVDDAAIATFPAATAPLGTTETYDLLPSDVTTSPSRVDGWYTMGVRVPHIFGVPERWLYLSLRSAVPSLVNGNVEPGILLHDVSFGFVDAEVYGYPYYRVDGAVAAASLLDPRPNWQGQTARHLKPGDAFIYENPADSSETRRRTLIEVLSFDDVTGNFSARVKLTVLHTSGRRSDAVAGCPIGVSCRPYDAVVPVAIEPRSDGPVSTTFTVTLTQRPGDSALLGIVRLSSTQGATAAIDICTLTTAWNATVATYTTAPLAALYGRDMSIAATEIIRIHAASGCQPLRLAIRKQQAPLFLAVELKDKVGATLPVSQTIALNAVVRSRHACDPTRGVNIFFDFGQRLGHLVPLFPVTPTLYRSLMHYPDLYSGGVEATLRRVDAASWQASFKLAKFDKSVTVIFNSTAADVPSLATSNVQASKVTDDSIFQKQLIGYASTLAAPVMCACSANMFIDADFEQCTPCGRGQVSLPGSGPGPSACSCARGAAVTQSTSQDRPGECSSCPRGSALFEGVCTPCESATAPAAPGTDLPLCVPRTCDVVNVELHDTSGVDVTGSYLVGPKMVNGYPYYSRANASSMYIAFVAYPVAQWQFMTSLQEASRGSQQSGTLALTQVSPPHITAEFAVDSTAVAAFFPAKSWWQQGIVKVTSPEVTQSMPLRLADGSLVRLSKWECSNADKVQVNPTSGLPIRTPPNVQCHPQFLRTIVSPGVTECRSCVALGFPAGSIANITANNCYCPSHYSFTVGGSQACGFPSKVSLSFPGFEAISGAYTFWKSRKELITTASGGSSSAGDENDATATDSALTPIYIKADGTSQLPLRMLSGADAPNATYFLRYSSQQGKWQVVADLPESEAALPYAQLPAEVPALPSGETSWAVFDESSGSFSAVAISVIEVPEGAVPVDPQSDAPITSATPDSDPFPTWALIVIVVGGAALIITGIGVATYIRRRTNQRRAIARMVSPGVGAQQPSDEVNATQVYIKSASTVAPRKGSQV